MTGAVLHISLWISQPR